MNQRSVWQHAFLVLLFWVLAFWACSQMLVPPALNRDQAETTSFSIDHALRHLRHIAAKPHPLGSSTHAEVASYLLNQIETLGYRPEIQETTVSARFDTPTSFIKAARIQNILVRVAGQNSQKAVLIAAHYDSAETSPGAADDGSAVASMLEVLRVLKNASPAKNDLIFLFSDAEETGLLGSRAFVEQHPWAKDCVLALNFEARGNGGVMLMFETSERNGRMVEQFERAAVRPLASSLMFSFYKKLMHNDTDFTIFREAGMAGMNFAFIEGGSDYHTALDNLERLDPRTLALQGRNMLQLTRHFADADLKTLRQDGDLGYFNLPFGKLCLFSLENHFPLLISVSALFLFAMLVGCCCRRRIVQCLFQMLILLLQTGLIAGVNFLFHGAIMRFYGHYRWLLEPYNAILYFLAACGLTVALFMLLHASLFRWIKPREYSAGALSLWLATGVYLALAFPGGVFFAVVPGVLMLADWTFRLFGFGTGTRSTFITAACSSAVLIIVAPTLYLAHHALGIHADWLLMTVAALTLSLISPATDILYRAFRWRLPTVFLAIACILLVEADRTSEFSRNRPKPNSILYAWDSSRNSAGWFSYDPEPDDWTRQFLTTRPAIRTAGIFDGFVTGRRLLARETPPIQLAIPSVRVVERNTVEGKKYIVVAIRSRRDAPLMRLKAPNLAKAIQIYADTVLIYQRNPAQRPLHFIEYHGIPTEGIKMTFVMPADTDIQSLQIVEIRPDLAEVWQENFNSRPENCMPMRSSSEAPVDAVLLQHSYPL